MPPQLRDAGFVALWHPGIMAATAVLAGAYLVAVGPLRRRIPGSARVPGRKVFSVLLGLAFFYLAVGSPLDELSDHYLMSAHMMEHLLLTFGAPPLVLMGMPDWLLRPFVRAPVIGRIWLRLTRPLTALVLFNLVFSLIHMPAIYDATLANDGLHFCEHALLVITALAMWWPVVHPVPELPALSDPLLLVYLFANEVFQTAAFALVTFAGQPLYAPYVAAPRIWGITPLEDQQMGGILMKLGAMASLGPALAIVFYRWAWREGASRVDLDGSPDARHASWTR